MFRDETVKVRKKFEETGTSSTTLPSSAASATGSSSPEAGADFIKSETGTEDSDAALSAIDKPGKNASQIPTAQGSKELTTIRGSNADGSLTLSEALAAFGGTLGNDGSPMASGKGRPLSIPRKQQRRQQGATTSLPPEVSPTPAVTVNLSVEAQSALVKTMLKGPNPTLFDRGLQFYLDHYLYGHPESPPKSGVIEVDTPWILDPATRTIAAAVGMAGIANLKGDDQIQMLARDNYGIGLKMTAMTIDKPGLDTLNHVMRSIVLLAMFEIVRGANQSFGSANIHVMGAAALMRHFLPILPTSLHPYRGLIQISCSLLISCQAAHIDVPPVFAEYIANTYRKKPVDDQIMSKLLLTLIEFINLSAFIHRQVLSDRRSDMVDHVVHALQLDARLIAWELNITEKKGIWKYEECETPKLPPEAVYKGRFHRYSDISTARIWSYYRWARILLNEMLLEFIEKCPNSVAAGLARLKMDTASASSAKAGSAVIGADTRDTDTEATEKLRRRALTTIKKCAEDIFVSTPVYWRHPSIPLKEYDPIATPPTVYGQNGGTGVATLMPTLFHLDVAARAPGVSEKDFDWALAVIDTVWAYLGLRQARTLADKMRLHRETMKRKAMGLNGMLLLTTHEDVDIPA
ncbi:hypothetical protein SPBR_06856 [Sporothrix brasiliensis 5110]|uniref:C6 zinc finger domain containing protein n=1 Tax=Sporothrix brasiliensis 5110 TaxID=1398154 RepID=A0A0C2IMA2_9PEZI|nr:uncharacterized protein SPBR_06856 [Sporothrix brasiliensis 5110]KIH88135.1 hypothetical protein SPBR_06856 [Sporothrix brasiliensis 5110]